MYNTFGPPVVSSAGTIAFKASNLGGSSPFNTNAIVTVAGGIGTEIVRPGMAAPDANGSFNSTSDFLAVNDLGQVAFATSYSNTAGGFGVDNFGMVRGGPPTRVGIARAGAAAVDGNGTITASFLAFDPPKINDFGDVAFLSRHTGTSNGSLDDLAILKGNVLPNGATQLIQIAREGWAAPDGNGEFAILSSVRSMNEAGVVAFESTLGSRHNP
jgi:hypothetical protein